MPHLRLKCTKFDFDWGSTQTLLGELTTLPWTLAGFKGPTFKESEGNKKEWREWTGPLCFFSADLSPWFRVKCPLTEMCGRGNFGIHVRPRLQILRPRPRPQESVDKRPRPHMSVNGVRGTDVKYSNAYRWWGAAW